MPLLRTAATLTAFVGTSLSAQAPRWTQFTEFRGIHDSLSMHWPSVVVVHDTTIVAANVFRVDATEFSGRHRLTIVRTPGGPLPVPPGEFLFSHPQLSTDSRGTLQLVWAEPNDSVVAATVWIVPPSALWHTSFRDGRWSTPQRLIAGRFLTWASDGQPVASSSDGRVHVVVPAALADGELAIVYIRIGTTGAVEQELHWRGGSYAAITAIHGDSLAVIYSTADSLTPRGGASTFVRISPDGGKSWSEPSVIARSTRRAQTPPIIEETDREFHALWLERSGAQTASNVARAFTAQSPLGPWTEVGNPLDIQGFPVRIVAAHTSCGAYSAILELIDNLATTPVIRLVELYVRDKHLIASAVFPQIETAANVGLASRGDSLRIVLSVLRPGEKTVVNATASSRACGNT